MCSDVKFLLGLVPAGVTLFLFFIGMQNFNAIYIGIVLAVLYGIVATSAKFYKTPPVHMERPYYKIFYINVMSFLLCLNTINGLACSKPIKSMSMDFKALIWSFMISIFLVFAIFPIKGGGFIGLKGKPPPFVRKWGIYFLFACLPLLFICFEVLSVPGNLSIALFLWGLGLIQYLMIKLAVKMG